MRDEERQRRVKEEGKGKGKERKGKEIEEVEPSRGSQVRKSHK